MKNDTIVLVTGGSGFVSMQIILQLLQKGYTVRATLRSLKGKDELIKMLQANGISSIGDLSFIEAELTKDDNWADAMKGCHYVLSVASPVFFDVPKDENDATRPALEGILRIFKICA